MKRRSRTVIAALVGLAYAVLVGFLSMMATGGGHGNFGWFLIFVFVDFLGFFYPVMAALAFNLRSFFSKVVFGSLLLFNLIATLVLVFGWMFEVSEGKPTDFEKTWGRDPIGVCFSASMQFMPILVLSFFIVREIKFPSATENNESLINLDID